jgi:hypothetical protein
MVIVPTMQIAWTLFGIISGMLYFEEYLDFTPLSAAMFCTGVLVSGLGPAPLLVAGSQCRRQPRRQAGRLAGVLVAPRTSSAPI